MKKGFVGTFIMLLVILIILGVSLFYSLFTIYVAFQSEPKPSLEELSPFLWIIFISFTILGFIGVLFS